jgi:glutamate dehydrogenase
MLAVLLGHAKMWAFQAALETDLPDGPEAAPLLQAYFPRRLQAFAAQFPAHPLRREIVATVAVNYVINEVGVTFLSRAMATTRKGIGEVVAAYLEVDREVQASDLRRRIETAGLEAGAENELLLELEDALEGMVRARLTSGTADGAAALEPIRARLTGAGAAAAKS